MNNNHVKGAVNDIKGKVKEDVGHVTGNDQMAGEGIIEQVKGKVQNALGDLKDAAKQKIDKVLHTDHNQSV